LEWIDGVLSTSMDLGEVGGFCQEVRMLGVINGVNLSEMGVTMHQEPRMGAWGGLGLRHINEAPLLMPHLDHMNPQRAAIGRLL
jgi:hypothetical protein